jgi:hypothetical protein
MNDSFHIGLRYTDVSVDKLILYVLHELKFMKPDTAFVGHTARHSTETKCINSSLQIRLKLPASLSALH